jgi:Uma2 family endonuclease
MSTLPRPRLSPEEYLDIERKAEFKSEYYNGEMFAMSGGSRYHDRIASQLSGLVWQHLRKSRCEMYTANMRVRTPGGLYTYPDLSIACAEPQFYDKEVDTLLNPTLLVEILSPSTEGYDRGRKAELYRAIPSLRELLIVAQDRLHVELFRRVEGGPWDFSEADGLGGSVELTSIGLTLRLSELYETAIAHDDKGFFKSTAG